MPKPIFIMTLAYQNGLSEAFDKYVSGIQKMLSDDYHVIVVADGSIQESKYQMFSDHEIEPIELEKLKEIVLKQQTK